MHKFTTYFQHYSIYAHDACTRKFKFVHHISYSPRILWWIDHFNTCTCVEMNDFYSLHLYISCYKYFSYKVIHWCIVLKVLKIIYLIAETKHDVWNCLSHAANYNLCCIACYALNINYNFCNRDNLKIKLCLFCFYSTVCKLWEKLKRIENYGSYT